MKVLITGAAGQDGTLLRRFLRGRGHEILGIARRIDSSAECSEELVRLDITDMAAVATTIREFAPEQVYHLAVCHQSSDQQSTIALDQEMLRTNVLALQTIASTLVEHLPACRLLSAGSSRMYSATAADCVVDEQTGMSPSTFYGWTKAWARELVAFYRERHGLYGVTAILFNHESPLRASTFVSSKITHAAARAKRHGRCELHLRDVGAAADWMSAGDAVEAMVLALSAPDPLDYVVASGTRHTVQDILEVAFGHVGLDWREFTRSDRSTAPGQPAVIGDPSRIRKAGWTPRVTFSQLISEMTAAALEQTS